MESEGTLLPSLPPGSRITCEITASPAGEPSARKPAITLTIPRRTFTVWDLIPALFATSFACMVGFGAVALIIGLAKFKTDQIVTFLCIAAGLSVFCILVLFLWRALINSLTEVQTITVDVQGLTIRKTRRFGSENIGIPYSRLRSISMSNDILSSSGPFLLFANTHLLPRITWNQRLAMPAVVHGYTTTYFAHKTSTAPVR